MSKLVVPCVAPSQTDLASRPVEEQEETSSSSSSDVELDPRSDVLTGDSDVRAGDTTFELPARESLRHLTKRQRRRAVERAIARQRLAALEAAPNAVEVPLLQPRYGRERRLHRSMRVTTEGSSVAHANAAEMMRGADQPSTSERLVVTMGDTSFASNVTFDQPYALYRHGKRRIYAHSLGYGADGDLIVERSEVAALTSDGFTSDSNARSLLRQLRGASASASGGRGARQPTSRDALEEAFSTDEVEAAKRVQLRRVQTTVSSAVCVDPRAAVPVDRFQATTALAAQARGSGLFGAARDAVSDAEACPRTAGMDRNLWRRKYPGVPCPKNRKVRNRLMNDFFVSEHTRPLVEAAREQRTTRSSSRKRSSSIPAALYDAPPPEHYDNDVCSSMTGGDFFPRGFPVAFRKLVHRDEDDQHAAIHQMIRDADEASPASVQRRPGSAKKRSGGTSASPSGAPSATVTPKLGPVSAATAYRLATLPAGDGGEALKSVQRTKAQAQLADPSSLAVARFQTLPLRLRAELQHAMDATEFMPQFIRDVEARVRTFVAAHAATTAAASAAQKRKGKGVTSPVSSPTTSTATMTPVAPLPVAVGAADSSLATAPTFPRTDSGSPMQVETTGVPEATPPAGPCVASVPTHPAVTIDVHCRDGYGRLIVHGISRFYGLVSKSEDLSETPLPPASESRGRPTTRGIHSGSTVAAPAPVLWGRITRIALPANGRVPQIPMVTLAELLTGKADAASPASSCPKTPPPAQPAEAAPEPAKAPKTAPPIEDGNAAAPKRFRKKRTLDSRRRILPLFF